MNDDATDRIRDLIKVLIRDYGVSNAEAQDLLDRIVAWALNLNAERRREMLRVIKGGKQ